VILVDTSVWIDHLRERSATLADALEHEEVMTHPFVIGELACGNLKDRVEVLRLLSTLRAVTLAMDREVLLLIERHRLMGRGIGYIDAHLIASVLLSDGAQLWTRDKRLRTVAAGLRVAFEKG
jgi:predicted nucleic acid-binding protein